MYKLRYNEATMFVWGWGRVLVTDPSLIYKLRYNEATMFVWGWGLGRVLDNRAGCDVQCQT
jgi:hypothetical protein